MKTFSFSHSGFTLVELIVGMTIFSIGLSAIYALLQSTMGNAAFSRHEIVIANLLREEIELVKNIRDTNVRNFISWESVPMTSGQTKLSSGTYIIENDFTGSGVIIDSSNGDVTQSPVKIKKINSLPSDLENVWIQTKLYLDQEGRYTHDATSTGTQFASYIKVLPLSYMDGGTRVTLEDTLGNPDGFSIDARVIVKTGNIYREYDAKSIITNWIK